MIVRRFVFTVALALLGLIVVGCVSPFTAHGQDIRDSMAQDASEAHRRWDRYFLGLDWDDPYHDWHDESYARGPAHQH